MEKITTVGLDLAKQVMAVCAMDAQGGPVMRKVLRRDRLLRWTAASAQIVATEELVDCRHVAVSFLSCAMCELFSKITHSEPAIPRLTVPRSTEWPRRVGRR